MTAPDAPAPMAANAACDRCGAAFACGAQAGAAAECWCMALPRIPMQDGAAACLCPDCLKAMLAKANPPPGA